MTNIQHKTPNFQADSGEWCLVRCFKCESEIGRENYAPSVFGGTCAWCGDDANKEEDNGND